MKRVAKAEYIKRREDMEQKLAYKEKRAIFIHRMIFMSVLIICFILSVAFAVSYGVSAHENGSTLTPTKLLTDSGKVNEFTGNGYTNYTLTLSFNNKEVSGTVTVSFFNSSGVKLETCKKEFYAAEKNATVRFYSIEGVVKSYNIDSLNIESDPASSPTASRGVLKTRILQKLFEASIKITAVALVLFVMTLLQSCKVYGYKGNVIIVYSGWFRRYISVNGVKLDEHNTVINLMPIYMSAVLYDETRLNVTITLTNRISLKINDTLYNGEIKQK